jgi:hypothetical protein
MNAFTRKLKRWCQYHQYIFNPEDMCNNGPRDKKQDRIIDKTEGKMTEYIYIRTEDEPQEKLAF